MQRIILINIPAVDIDFPLKHPKQIKINTIADDFSFGIIWGGVLKKRYLMPVRGIKLVFKKIKHIIYR